MCPFIFSSTFSIKIRNDGIPTSTGRTPSLQRNKKISLALVEEPRSLIGEQSKQELLMPIPIGLRHLLQIFFWYFVYCLHYPIHLGPVRSLILFRNLELCVKASIISCWDFWHYQLSWIGVNRINRWYYDKASHLHFYQIWEWGSLYPFDKIVDGYKNKWVFVNMNRHPFGNCIDTPY